MEKDKTTESAPARVKVSIKCMVYNHAAVLRECLDGFVSQQCPFRFEAIVHDDASTDGSADIIREYAARYPHIIIPVIETENLYSRDVSLLNKAFEKECRGEYVAICEGDDVWTDPHKLARQVEILDANPGCSLVLTNGTAGPAMDSPKCRLINPFGKGRPSGMLTPREALLEVGDLVPTASICGRRRYIVDKRPDFMYPYRVGDRPIRMWAMLNGDIYYLAEPMVFHRVGLEVSFSASIRRNPEFARRVASSFMEYLDNFDAYTGGRFASEVKYLKGRQQMSLYANLGTPWKFLVSPGAFHFFSKRERPLYEYLRYAYHCLKGM